MSTVANNAPNAAMDRNSPAIRDGRFVGVLAADDAVDTGGVRKAV
jgi:hypothetical protein